MGIVEHTGRPTPLSVPTPPLAHGGSVISTSVSLGGGKSTTGTGHGQGGGQGGGK